MQITRPPRPSLRPFVERLWAIDEQSEQVTFGAREHVLPTGAMHLVFRLSDQPRRVFDGAGDPCGCSIGRAVVGGARSTFYIRDVSTPSCSVGAMLRPGAARLLFAATADELSQRHTRLDDLWGRSAHFVEEQLRAAVAPASPNHVPLPESELFAARS